MQELVNDPRSYLALAALVGLVFAIGRWVGEVNSDRKSFKEFMAEMRQDMRDIHRDIKHVLTALGRLGSNVVGGTSPLRLTELGKRVSEAIEAPALVADLAQSLLSQAEGKRPHEIARLADDYVHDTFEPTAEQLDGFDAVAYEEGITRFEVFQVIALELRDHLLAQTSPGLCRPPPCRTCPVPVRQGLHEVQLRPY